VRKKEISRKREELSEKERKREKEGKTNHDILDFFTQVFSLRSGT